MAVLEGVLMSLEASAPALEAKFGILAPRSARWRQDRLAWRVCDRAGGGFVILEAPYVALAADRLVWRVCSGAGGAPLRLGRSQEADWGCSAVAGSGLLPPRSPRLLGK